jgi:hypothetical protein
LTIALPIAFAALCVGLGVYLMQDDRPGSRLGGVGLWVFAAGPTFVALDAAGIAPGASGTMNLALIAGWPLLGLGWGLSRVEFELANRLRPLLFVVLLIAAMLDPRTGTWALAVDAGALGVQAIAALTVRRAWPTTLGLLGAVVPLAVLLQPTPPSWAPVVIAVSLVLSAVGLRALPKESTP